MDKSEETNKLTMQESALQVSWCDSVYKEQQSGSETQNEMHKW